MSKVMQHNWNRSVWAIANADGAPWSHRVFDSELEAIKYLEAQQAANRKWDLSKHTVKRASVTVRFPGCRE